MFEVLNTQDKTKIFKETILIFKPIWEKMKAGEEKEFLLKEKHSRKDGVYYEIKEIRKKNMV